MGTYNDGQGHVVQEYNGEVEGRAVMVRRSGGYSDFSVGDNDLVYIRYMFLNFLHSETAPISEVLQKIWY